MPSRDEALEWAARLAAACRCAQEVRAGDHVRPARLIAGAQLRADWRLSGWAGTLGRRREAGDLVVPVLPEPRRKGRVRQPVEDVIGRKLDSLAWSRVDH